MAPPSPVTAKIANGNSHLQNPQDKLVDNVMDESCLRDRKFVTQAVQNADKEFNLQKTKNPNLTEQDRTAYVKNQAMKTCNQEFAARRDRIYGGGLGSGGGLQLSSTGQGGGGQAKVIQLNPNSKGKEQGSPTLNSLHAYNAHHNFLGATSGHNRNQGIHLTNAPLSPQGQSNLVHQRAVGASAREVKGYPTLARVVVSSPEGGTKIIPALTKPQGGYNIPVNDPKTPNKVYYVNKAGMNIYEKSLMASRTEEPKITVVTGMPVHRPVHRVTPNNTQTPPANKQVPTPMPKNQNIA